MKKVLNITWKDLLLLLHDRAALILMLLAPFVLTLGLGAVTGAFAPQQSAISDIPILLINQDRGELGKSYIQALESDAFAELFALTIATDEAAARQQVENDQAAALILIPPAFSDSMLAESQAGNTGSPTIIEIFASPERPNSASIIYSVVDEITNQMEAGPISTQLAIQGLLNSGRLEADPTTIRQAAAELGERLQARNASQPAIEILQANTDEPGGAQNTNILAYFAPAMATFFLMYTVTQGGRSILIEREFGTLSRMLSSPTSSTQVLAGKLSGIFVAGFLQVTILILATAGLFSVRWGDPLAVTSLIISVCLAATGWGILLASLANTPWQVGGIGSALMLIFGLLGGTFTPTSALAEPVRKLAMITPNFWANEGFLRLAQGGTLQDVLPMVEALLLLATTLFIISVLFARKRWASGFAKK